MSSTSIQPTYVIDGSCPSATHSCGSPAGFDSTSNGSRLAELVCNYAVTRRLRRPGDYLFRAGSTFQFLYVLSGGFAKSCTISEDGRERTIGIHLRGDIIGLDAVATGTHGSDAVALNGCEIMAIPYDAVIAGCHRNPDLVRELHRAFSAEIRSDRVQMLNMTSLSAEARVGSFLLETSVRFASRGFSADKLRLQLTRQEIGSMLGLTLETVSRAFSRLAKLGLITVCLREIVLLDHEHLLEFCSQPGKAEGQAHVSLARNETGPTNTRLRSAELKACATAA